MKCFSFLVIFLFTFVNCDEDFSSSIVGGVDAHILDHPYMAKVHVMFRNNWVPACGSSIINRRSLLTAAHCLEVPGETGGRQQLSANDVQVSVGSSYRLGTRGSFHTPFRLIRHPAYFLGPAEIIADIAVIRLLRPLIFTPMTQPIPIRKYFVYPGDRVLAVGWGAIDAEENVATRLQKLEMSAISNLQCWNIHRPMNLTTLVREEIVCVNANPGQGACSGDSGGPIVYNDELVGVACFTVRPCGSAPTGYVRTSYHYDWIMRNV